MVLNWLSPGRTVAPAGAAQLAVPGPGILITCGLVVPATLCVDGRSLASVPPLADCMPQHLLRSWRAVLGRLEIEMNPNAFDTWLRDTRPRGVEQGEIVIEAQHGVDCDWLNSQLACLVNRAVTGVFGSEASARFVPRGLSAGATARGGVEQGSEGATLVGSLNRSFTFDRYVPGPSNRLAVDAARGVLGADSLCPNPLTIYGAPGLGKTHLLHAIASCALERGWNVGCVGAEDFTNRYQIALRTGKVEQFHSQMRSLRLLALDDLQYLRGRRATTDEFIHTLETITNSGGSVLCVCDRSPRSLELPEALISRLLAGACTRVEPLGPGERRTFVVQRAAEQRISLPGWAIDRLAGCEVASVRALQGAVNAALMLSRAGCLELADLDRQLVLSCDSRGATGRDVDERALIDAVAGHFRVTREELIGRSRRQPVREARATAVAALSQRGHTLSQLGAIFGSRDRSTMKDLRDRGRSIIEHDDALRSRLAG